MPFALRPSREKKGLAIAPPPPASAAAIIPDEMVFPPPRHLLLLLLTVDNAPLYHVVSNSLSLSSYMSLAPSPFGGGDKSAAAAAKEAFLERLPSPYLPPSSSCLPGYLFRRRGERGGREHKFRVADKTNWEVYPRLLRRRRRRTEHPRQHGNHQTKNAPNMSFELCLITHNLRIHGVESRTRLQFLLPLIGLLHLLLGWAFFPSTSARPPAVQFPPHTTPSPIMRDLDRH